MPAGIDVRLPVEALELIRAGAQPRHPGCHGLGKKVTVRAEDRADGTDAVSLALPAEPGKTASR